LGTERHVVFFFSPGSRYSYLAASQVPRIETDTGCRFDWRPVRGTEIRAFRGCDPFKGEPVSGQYEWGYRERDAEMWAEYYGIPFREPPNHELDFDLLARAAATGKLMGAAASYGWALCAAAYGSETWPVDRDVCLGLAEEVGLARGEVDRLIDDPAPQELLSRAAREAHERGAFGVPTFFFSGRMYWGNDRLVLLEHVLRGP
jgi:2-hydroxychromene-2-carboxylate isomerase